MTGARSFTTRPREALVVATLGTGGGVVAEFLENGALFALRHGDILVNGLLGSPMGGGIGNVFLRSFEDGVVQVTPLTGPAAPGSFVVARDHVQWTGSWRGLETELTFRLEPDDTAWRWAVRVENRTAGARAVDVVLAQDLGLATEGAVRTNELYTSQYLDHAVFRDPVLGYVLCSRQNLDQAGAHPWIVHACASGAAGYLTDGFQLWGPASRATGDPIALHRPRLPNRRLQYEAALPTLQSRRTRLRPGAVAEVNFVAVFRPDHPAASAPADLDLAREAVARVRAPAAAATAGAQPSGVAGPVVRTATLFDRPARFASREPDPAMLSRWFGRERRHEEWRDGELLSFFGRDGEHVVLRPKELLVDRPTGHILRSGRSLLPADDTLTVTAWMSGVFGSQLALGNSAFNKLLTVLRSPLDLVPSSGRRVFVRIDGAWTLLGIPSAFAMTTHGVRWLYDDGEHALEVRLATSIEDPACVLEVTVDRGGPLQLLIADALVLGQDEYGPPAVVTIDDERRRIELRPGPGSAFAEHYPDALYHLGTPDPAAVAALTGDGALHADGIDRGLPWVAVRTTPVERFRLVVTGSLTDAAVARSLADRYTAATPSAAALAAAGAAWMAAIGGRPTLRHADPGVARDLGLDRLDEAVPWFVHDAVIHVSTPHGLEQYSGAAWGLRDVCQGPVELLTALGRPAVIADILRVVFAHQVRATGDWPQWFMVDRYRGVQAPDSHGDIVVWPIKALCDYLEATGDLAILADPVPWADAPDDPEPIATHAARQVDAIEQRFVPGTALVRFGHGDWEDTLQPADPAMAERLVSSWTVELAYESLGRYRDALERAGPEHAAMAARLEALCTRMHADFGRLLIPDGVVAGLVELRGATPEYLLHPRDRRTGVHYRLLPMTRGILSGILTPAQARRHTALIRRHLSFPDGVRLMDRPMPYRGGTEHLFRRAESAASFGREVGLQYVHAHIRYVQAMARLGHAEAAWEGLLAVCPVGLEHTVARAHPRQANAYFSSSDAAFADRAEAGAHFGRIRQGGVGFKGGWRVYSSGPGIWLEQLVGAVLGIRLRYDDVLLDPVLPRRADGITLDRDEDGRRVRYRYHLTGDGRPATAVRINGQPLDTTGRAPNPYRTGGLLIPRTAFRAALDRPDNVVDITA